MVVSALARGGGALALGVVLGALLALLGAGRLWLAARRAAPAAGGERRAEARAAHAGARAAARSQIRRGSERAGARISRGLGEPALFAIR